MRIVIGSEHAGTQYRRQLAQLLKSRGHKIYEIEESDQRIGYPAVADDAAQLVIHHKVDLGILICGTGIGMCMAAGKIPGIRAALCTTSYMGAMAKRHNNANMLIFGSRVIGFESMVHILDTFLAQNYEGGRHNVRLDGIRLLEEKYKKL